MKKEEKLPLKEKHLPVLLLLQLGRRVLSLPVVVGVPVHLPVFVRDVSDLCVRRRCLRVNLLVSETVRRNVRWMEPDCLAEPLLLRQPRGPLLLTWKSVGIRLDFVRAEEGVKRPRELG